MNDNRLNAQDSMLNSIAGTRILLRLIAPDDSEAEGVQETPVRFVKAMLEMTSGYSMNPDDILSKCFDQNFDEMIILKNIEFVSVCEHHLLPFIGTASIGYLPNQESESKKVVGLSKLARLLDCFAKRLQIQERLTNQIADALEESLQPSGIGVQIEAKHFCMICRGVMKSNASMITSVFRGVLRSKPEARAEFLSLINGK
jgi:GTP cyclohydrolase IA